jgi:CheY-like chemotaxis protein
VEPSSPKGIVAIVEDEWLIRMELSDAFLANGWRTIELAAGEAALALLASGQAFDVLVTDIRLGGPATGWDVAESFRARHPTLRVIYASGNAPLRDRQVADSLFLSKPVRIDELVVAAGGNRS